MFDLLLIAKRRKVMFMEVALIAMNDFSLNIKFAHLGNCLKGRRFDTRQSNGLHLIKKTIYCN